MGVRLTIDVLDSENQPGSGKIRTGSGALGIKGDVWHQKYENKKEGFKNYKKYSFNWLFKISHPLRYRAPDPVFGQNLFSITGKKSTIYLLHQSNQSQNENFSSFFTQLPSFNSSSPLKFPHFNPTHYADPLSLEYIQLLYIK